MISGFSTICRDHDAERVQQRLVLAVGQRDQSGTIENRKMLSQQKISAVGAAALAAEHGQRQARAHIADIAVAAGKPGQRHLAQRQPADQLPGDHGQREGAAWCRAWSQSGMAGC